MAQQTNSDRVRATREVLVPIPGETFRFRVRRPTFLQYRKMKLDGMDEVEILLHSIVGWENVLERDVFPSGSDQPLEFDWETCQEWVGDKETFWKPLAEALNALTEKRVADSEQARGN